MSHNPRTTGDDESDIYSELRRAAVLLKEAEDFEALKLPPVATRTGAPEEALWNVLEFLRTTTERLNRDLYHPDSTIVLSGKTRSDDHEGERRNQLVTKALILELGCGMVRDLLVELDEIYVPGKDLSSIGEIMELLKKHIPVLENDLKRF